MFTKETIKNLPNNNRFYVLAFSFLLSVFVVCWLRVQVAGDQLYFIQVEQTFAFLAAGFLYATLIISPIQRIIGKPEWMKNIIFARRGIGMSVLYFALLHAGTSFVWQIGWFDGLAILPERFVWPLIFGLSALVVFLIVGITSFDKVVLFVGYPKWKQIQRLTYAGGLLIIIHAWAIGAHFGSGVVPAISFGALVILFGLQSWRIVGFLVERYHLGDVKRHIVFLVVWFVWVVLLGLVAYARPADAHMLLKDTVSGTGAILHVNPDDDPVAGEETSFLFDIQADLPATDQSIIRLTITDDQQHATVVSTRIKDNTVAADYVFPRQGLYKVTLDIEQGGKQIHQFVQSQRVSRGVINSNAVVADSTPLWAEAGSLGAAMAAIVVAAIAFSRRKDISTYSKL